MMKRLLVAISLSLAMIWSISAMAEDIGIVNMRQIFQSSPQIKQINTNLNKQFSPQRDKIVAMGKSLQANIKKLQRNQAVMDKKSIANLRTKIQKQETDLRTAQANFQRALFAAQNKAMGAFMTKLTGVVKTIAEQKKLDLVLPKNSVLYAKDGMDITSEVVKHLK